MARVIILHGSYGYPEGNWFPWLKAELEAVDIEAVVPRFPTPSGQSLAAWTKVFEQTCGLLTSDDILIGHSAGAAFAMRLLESSPVPVRGAIFVSGFVRALGLDEFDPILETFFVDPFNWSEIRRKSGRILQYHCTGDTYVSHERGKEIADKPGIEMRVVEDGGHLNIDAGYTEFPQVLNDILEIAEEEYSTHAVAVLSRAGIEFSERTFSAREYSAEEVAEKLSIPLNEVYKTLIARTTGGEIVAGVVPGDRELDLAKLAKAVGSPAAALVKLGEIETLTGYLKGGCSPIGLKIQYQVIVDSKAKVLGPISVSAGERGRQVILKAVDLLSVVPGKFADIARY